MAGEVVEQTNDERTNDERTTNVQTNENEQRTIGDEVVHNNQPWRVRWSNKRQTNNKRTMNERRMYKRTRTNAEPVPLAAAFPSLENF